jgi:cytochrome c oxidase cbb3-type subunit 2
MKHEVLEKNSILLLVCIMLTVSIGGLVQIAPLFWVDSTIEKVNGMRPYTPLELAGRDIYVREGCYLCHSQMIRTLKDEVERYGHYSLAAESMYDHPFQWGSKRTGPDLARVGGKYSDQWHAEHLTNPRSVVPESIMPNYSWLGKTKLDTRTIQMRMKTQATLGTPYSKDMIDKALTDITAQVSPDTPAAKEFVDRYRVFSADKKSDPKIKVANFDGDSSSVTELDAVVAYLQMLGTLVDFASFDKTPPPGALR